MTPEELEQHKRDMLFQPLNSAEELREWVYLFFGIYFPSGVVFPTSTHGPTEAMWRIYQLFKTGESAEVPQVCMLSSRDSFKTLCAAALEVLCMIHFKMPCCHMAAQEGQSLKAIQYVNSNFRKIKPYLEFHGWKQNSDNKRIIEWITSDGVNIYLKIVIATIAGANSEHVPMLCVDGEATLLLQSGKITTLTQLIQTGAVGQRILTFNENTHAYEYDIITNAQNNGNKHVLNVHLMTLDGIEFNIKTTVDHKIYTETGWKEAQYLTELDSILVYTNKTTPQYAEVKSILYGGEITVYDLTLKNNHNFFANGILVHNCIDEVDVIQNPKALDEAKMIPSAYGDINPLTIYLSTRKFAGGMMEKTLKATVDSGGEVLRWNILDVTERIPYSVAQPDLPKVVRYISRELPMENLTPDEWKNLSDEGKNRFERFEAYAGIAEHPMLPVMRNFLVDRSQDDNGYLYKRLTAVRNNFRQIPADMATAQLLCDKPSSSGLVYSRFEVASNVLTPREALEKLTGEVPVNDSFEYLRDYLMKLGVTFIGGSDWGFTDCTSLIVLAVFPNGEVWLMDGVVEPKLELDDIVKYCRELQLKWNVEKWFMEQAYPAYLVTLRKAGLKCPEFIKVVADGIAALQAKIVNSTNQRNFFIIKQPRNELAISAFGEYKWKLDGKGDIIEGVPYHDKDGVSDIMDSIRYPMQNLFSKGGKIMFTANSDEQKKSQDQTLQEKIVDKNASLMYGKLKELAPNIENEKKDVQGPRKRVMWY